MLINLLASPRRSNLGKKFMNLRGSDDIYTERSILLFTLYNNELSPLQQPFQILHKICTTIEIYYKHEKNNYAHF